MLKMGLLQLAVTAVAFAPARSPLTARPVGCSRSRPGASILMQEGAKAENEEARMANMYKPGSEQDPFQAERPKFGLAPATGRSTEAVFGADFPAPAELQEWAELLRAQGVEQLLFVYEGESEEHSSYVAALATAGLGGFAADAVTAVDMLADDAAQRTAEATQAAAKAGAKICVHGGPFTLVLAQWVLADYIGSENCEEACDLLSSRKRFGGVGWEAEPADVERFLGLEDDGAPPAAPPPPPEPTGPIKVSKGGILLG